MISPQKQIAKLTAHGISLSPNIGGAGFGLSITPADVSASLAMISSRQSQALLLAKYADDVKAKRALYLFTYYYASHLARTEHWFKKKYNDRFVEKIACTAVSEHLMPRTCSRCNGHGEITGQGTCDVCGGIGKVHYRSKHYCEELNLSRSQWWRVWQKRYTQIISQMNEWEQLGLGVVVHNLRNE